MCVCGKAGHLAKDCWQGQGGKIKAKKRRGGKEGKGKESKIGMTGFDAGSLGGNGTCPRTVRRASLFIDWPNAGTEVTAEQASWQQPSQPEASIYA